MKKLSFLVLSVLLLLSSAYGQHFRGSSGLTDPKVLTRLTPEAAAIIRYNMYRYEAWSAPLLGGYAGGYNSIYGGYVSWNYVLPNGTAVGGYEGWGPDGSSGGYISWNDGVSGGYDGWNGKDGQVIHGGYEAGIDGKYKGWNNAVPHY